MRLVHKIVCAILFLGIPGLLFGYEFEQEKFSNGITGWKYTSKDLVGPLELRIVVGGGGAQEGASRLGMHGFFGQIMHDSLNEFLAENLVNELPYFSFEVMPDGVIYNISFNKGDPDSVEVTGRFLIDWFAGKYLTKENLRRQQEKDAEKEKRASGPRVAESESCMSKFFYQGGKYGGLAGAILSPYVSKFSSQVVTRIFRSWYQADRMSVVMVGDPSKAEAMEQFAARIGSVRFEKPDKAVASANDKIKIHKGLSGPHLSFVSIESTQPLVALQLVKTYKSKPLSGIIGARNDVRLLLHSKAVELALLRKRSDSDLFRQLVEVLTIDLHKLVKDLSSQVVTAYFHPESLFKGVEYFLTSYAQAVTGLTRDDIEHAALWIEDQLCEYSERCGSDSCECADHAALSIVHGKVPEDTSELMLQVLRTEKLADLCSGLQKLTPPGLGARILMDVKTLGLIPMRSTPRTAHAGSDEMIDALCKDLRKVIEGCA